MFAPRSGLSNNVGNRGGAVQSVGPHNENSLIPRYNSSTSNKTSSLNNGSASNVTKTPAASGRRRALGDISNKKGGLSSQNQNHHRNKNIPTSVNNHKGSELKKPSFILQENTTAPRKGLSQKSTKKKGLSASNIPAPGRTVDFQLPTKSSRAVSVLPQTQSSVQVKETLTDKKVEPVPDVEILAGRSYEQQVANGEWDDDSPVDLSMEMPLTMWDDWKESLQLQLEEQQKRHAEEDAKFHKELEEKMAKIFEEDAKGVDCLPDHFEEEISINGPYGASYDDDEWSNMASSDMGDDLLFEL